MMARAKIEYSPEELNRDTHYMVVTGSRGIQMEMVDLYEARNYRSSNDRKALMVYPVNMYRELAEQLEFDDVAEINFTHVMNFSSPAVKIVKVNEQAGLTLEHVFEVITTRYKNGLVVIGRNEFDASVFDMLAGIKGAGIDFMVNRDRFENLSENERLRVTAFRVHAQENFDFTPAHLNTLGQLYGHVIAFGLILAQYIANYQYSMYAEYMGGLVDEKGQDNLAVHVDFEEVNMYLSYFVYFDIATQNIIGCSEEMFRDSAAKLLSGMFNEPEDKVDVQKLVDAYMPVPEDPEKESPKVAEVQSETEAVEADE